MLLATVLLAPALLATVLLRHGAALRGAGCGIQGGCVVQKALGTFAHGRSHEASVHADELGAGGAFDELFGGLHVQGRRPIVGVCQRALAGMERKGAGVSQLAGPAAIPFKPLGVVSRRRKARRWQGTQGGGHEGDAGFGQVGGFGATGGEARHEVFAAKHDRGDPRGGAGQIGEVEVGLGQLDQQVDGEVPFGQSQLFFFVGQEVVKGFDFVYPARHRQYEPAEGGMGDFVEVEQQPAGVVHAVAAHEDLDPCGHGLGENGLDGLAPGGLVAGADAVFYVQDDGAGTGGKGRGLVVQLEEIRAAHVHGAVMGRGAGGR